MFPSIFPRTLKADSETYRDSCSTVWGGFLAIFGLKPQATLAPTRRKPSVSLPAIATVIATVVIFSGDGLVVIQSAQAEEAAPQVDERDQQQSSQPMQTTPNPQPELAPAPPIADPLPESASLPGAASVVSSAPPQTSLGVDLGSSQAGMNLDTFADQGGGYAIIKHGGANVNGSPYLAPKYSAQVSAAREAGLPVGHYWFNGQQASIDEQAEFFTKTAKVEPGDIIALDIEDEPATATRPFTPQEAKTWIEGVRKKYPDVKVLLYMNVPTIKQADWSELTDNPLWVASFGKNDGTIGRTPSVGPWPDWTIWQYSSTVRVPGFNGAVDANIAKLDLFSTHGWKPGETESKG